MKKNQNGQVLLIVLLAMATLATVVLSIVSRSVSEVGVTSREEDSVRAFSAAEAGVEEALITGTQQDIVNGSVDILTKNLTVQAPNGSDSTVSTYTVNVDRYPETANQFPYPFGLLSGQAASVWLATRDGDTILPCGSGAGQGECFTGNTIRLCWGTPGVSGPETPAIVANVIYKNSLGDYGMAPVGFDSMAATRGNGYAPASVVCTVAGERYAFYADVNLGAGGLGITNTGGTPILMRVATFYNVTTPHTFGVSSANNFPIQGRKVSSQGAAGEVSRKIDAFLLNPEMPFIFDSSVYSPEDIEK